MKRSPSLTALAALATLFSFSSSIVSAMSPPSLSQISSSESSSSESLSESSSESSSSTLSRRPPRLPIPADDTLQPPLAQVAPCIRLLADQIATASGCGHRYALAYWLHSLPHGADLSLSDIEAAYIRAGCSLEEAVAESRITASFCRQVEPQEQWTPDESPAWFDDLVVYSMDDDDNNNILEPMPDAAQLKAEGWVVVVESVSVAASAPADMAVPPIVPGVTTPPAPYRTSYLNSNMLSDDGLPVELRRRQATDDASPSSSSSSSSSLECSTTRTVDTTTCPIATTGTDKGLVLPCVPTTVNLAHCAPGLICSDEKDVCMVAKTDLDTGGIIVTITFSVALTVAIALLTFMCCRERAMHKRLAAKAEAAELAREAAAQRKEPSAVTEPLISGRGTGSRAGSRRGSFSGGQGTAYGVDSTNPFADRNRL